MKMKIYNEKKKPLTKKFIKLKVKGEEVGGTLSFITDERGEIQLPDYYQGKEIAVTSPNQSQWVTAAEGASISLYTETEEAF